MVKGTPSMGRKNKVTHIRCRRCGRTSYRIDKKYCAACGYGRSAAIRSYNWLRKTFQRMRKY
ncbi:MAG: 50S ribosomal protein L37e [Candidatus Aenigmarchaeota archaeon]|nr:50S ribosomal protein L37e [Candidatus Aenigmarchaeota archaeon]